MKIIYKYPIPQTSGYSWYNLYIRVDMPKGAKILSAGEKEDKDTWSPDTGIGISKLYLWAIVDTDQPIVEHTILVVGTGRTFAKDDAFEDVTFIDTVHGKHGYIWHIFDAGENNDKK